MDRARFWAKVRAKVRARAKVRTRASKGYIYS